MMINRLNPRKRKQGSSQNYHPASDEPNSCRGPAKDHKTDPTGHLATSQINGDSDKGCVNTKCTKVSKGSKDTKSNKSKGDVQVVSPSKGGNPTPNPKELIFSLARKAKGLQIQEGKDVDLVAIHQKWFDETNPSRPEIDYTETLIDFLRATEVVKFPEANFLDIAITAARKSKKPIHPILNPIARDGRIITIALVCRELSSITKGTFFISSTQIAQKLELSQPTAFRNLQALQALKVIKMLKTGTNGKANTYKYLLDDAVRPFDGEDAK